MSNNKTAVKTLNDSELLGSTQRLHHATMYRQCYLLQKQWEVLERMTLLVEKSENKGWDTESVL